MGVLHDALAHRAHKQSAKTSATSASTAGCSASLRSSSTLLGRAGTTRAIDQHGQVIDVLLSARRNLTAAREFFTRALRAGTVPVEVTTDRAPAYPRVLDELVPHVLHCVEQYANNPVEADHGRLKARLRPMRGLKRHRSARTVVTGHAFVQNLRRGHMPSPPMNRLCDRLRLAFDELARAI